MKNYKIKHIALYLAAVATLCACSPTPQPKPYAYFRISLPEATYTNVDSLGSYRADINQLCQANRTDDTWASASDEWINLYYPLFDATVHLSYKNISKEMFKTISEEGRTLAYKHTIRADAIIESYYADDDKRTYGILYEMKGNAASPAQFFLTDSVRHFLRGAIYFNATPNADSIAPVASYIEQDVIHLIETLEWKN